MKVFACALFSLVLISAGSSSTTNQARFEKNPDTFYTPDSFKSSIIRTEHKMIKLKDQLEELNEKL